jgi:chitin disaccharide deacetylase
MSTRRLIVTADDFGRSDGVNRGVVSAHEHGIVTSASLMVRWPAAEGAAALARDLPRLSVGLHVDFGEWTYRDGAWVQAYAVVEENDPSGIAAEGRRQLALFRDLLDREPTHLDSHQHVHRAEPVYSCLVLLANELGVPLRHSTPGVEYRGDFHGQTAHGQPLAGALTVEGLTSVLQSLSPGTSELGCHPAADVDFETAYGNERLVELDVLCSSEIRDVLAAEDISLLSFGELHAA